MSLSHPPAFAASSTTIPTRNDSASPPAERLHGLDALRAAALFGGIVLHAQASFVNPPGFYAPVGTTHPNLFLSCLSYYLHSFRLEIFFLLAGFFGAMVVKRRGMRAYLRDRFIRVVLVLIAFLYPMKYVVYAIWISGGLAMGQPLPTELGTLPAFAMPFAVIASESWPNVTLLHLWFLYLLACLVATLVAARWLFLWLRRLSGIGENATAGRVDRLLVALVASRAWPLVLAAVIGPLIIRMDGNIWTPAARVTVPRVASCLYMIFFAFGWWLFARQELLRVWVQRWRGLLLVGLFAGLVGWGLLEFPQLDAARYVWLSSFARALAMTTSVFGFVGAFVYAFDAPSARVRYLADSSYWVYIVHFPVVMGMQVWFYDSGLPWWIEVPFVNAVGAIIPLLTYRYFVRDTWIGRWLNGPRARRPMPELREGADQIPAIS